MTDWTKKDAVHLRQNVGRVIDALRAEAPSSLSQDDLIKLPAESIARQQLLLTGYDLALKNLRELSIDPVSGDDASQ